MLSRRQALAILAVPVLPGQDRGLIMHTDAEAYERFMGRWSRLVAHLVVDFADLPDSGSVLDVGSGSGSLAFVIAEQKPRCRVQGIDLSKRYVAYANRKNPFPARATFRAGDAQQLPFPDAAFDASVSLLVFNFIPTPGRALEEMRRVTKPGARLTAAVWDYGGGMEMLREFWDAAASIDENAENQHEKHMPLCRGGELSELWKRGGLENVHEQPLDVTMRFESFADYWDPFLLGQGPAGVYVRSLSRDQLQALRDELKHRLSVSKGDEPFPLPARAWAVRGSVPFGL
jgi:SAM-dependent methyltransferase